MKCSVWICDSALIALAAIVASGCGSTEAPQAASPPPTTATNTGAPPPLPSMAEPVMVNPSTGAPVAAAPQTAAPGAAADPNMVREQASAELTKKGVASAPIGQGLISTPAKIYLRAQDRAMFEMQIPKTMQLFQATNGYFPRSQEEFMREIIEANNYTLPELEADSRYVYDPETGELLVEHPQ